MVVLHSINFSLHIYVIQYYYALDGYPFIPTALFFFEVFVLILFVFLLSRKCFQFAHWAVEYATKNGRHEHSRVAVEEGDTRPQMLNPSSALVNYTEQDLDLEADDLKTHKEDVEKMPSVREDAELMDNEASNSGKGSKIQPLSVDSGSKRLNSLESPNAKSVSNAPGNVKRSLTFKEKVIAKMETLNIPDNVGWGHLLDCSSITMLAVAIAYRLVYIERCRYFQTYMTQFPTDFEKHFNKIIQLELDIAGAEYAMRLCALFVLALSLMQFFRYVSFDKRLGLVTATLYNSLHDLAPIMFVFCTVFTAYAVIGCQMYGQQLPEFETFTDSLTTLLLMVLGEYGAFVSSM